MPSYASTGVVYADMTYCAACDRYFPNEEARTIHVQFSANHPKCEPCNKRFANLNSLRTHWVVSSKHHYCSVCDLTFQSAAGLRVHVEFAAVHRDDSDDEDDGEDDGRIYHLGWEDEMGRQYYPEEDDPVASDNESFDDVDEYWDEDDQLDGDEDYYGFAPTSTFDPNAVYPIPRALSEDSNVSVGGISHTAVGTVSDDGFLDFEDDPDSDPADVTEVSYNESRGLVLQQSYIPPSAVVFNCPLCLEAPRETSATRCGHVFCTPCINTALESKKMCPVCRMRAGPMQLRKIFLSAN